MDKQRLLNHCCVAVKKLINFSVSAQYIAVIAVFITAFIGGGSFAGFGVDSEDNLYIGRKVHIEVYHDGKCVEVLPTPFQKEAWHMGISPDDHILLTGSGMVFTANLDGTIIEENEDINSRTEVMLANQKRIEDNKGNQYQLRSKHFWPTITKNGKVVYRAPFWDMLVRILFISGWIIIIISGFSNYAAKSDNTT